jgi:hypothetical protein
MNKTNQAKLNSLMQQLTDLKSELTALKQERAEARVSGGNFANGDRILAIAAEIEEIDEAVPVVQKLVDADEARVQALNEADRTEGTVAAYEKLFADYIEGVSVAESASKELRAALSLVHRVMPQLSEVAFQVSGQRDEAFLNRPNADARLLNRMAQILSNDVQPLAQFRATAMDENQWLPSWAEEESRHLKNMFGKHVFRLKQRAAELRASAAE